MQIHGPIFVKKNGYFLLTWVKALSQQVGFFFIFEQILPAGLSD